MSHNHEILFHSERCIGCGLCVSDCVANHLFLEGGTVRAKEVGCIACGHCEAICPQSAIELAGFDDVSIPYEQQTRLDPNTLLMAIKSRRSIRSFTEQAVDPAVLQQILEAGRLAPTGSNAQDTGFIILGSKQAELEALSVQMFRNLTGVAKVFSSYLREMEIDDHFFFKKAPLVIVLTGNAVNASLAAENMAFMAEAYGLGVLFSGFYTVCANKNSKIRDIMGMEKHEKAVTTLVIGHPAVQYHRTAKREKAKTRIL